MRGMVQWRDIGSTASPNVFSGFTKRTNGFLHLLQHRYHSCSYAMRTTMKKLLLLIAFFALFTQAAVADWTGKDASGTTITFANPNTCSSVACIPTAQLVNASGSTLLGTAGTANAGVITVQGIASMTALLANPGTAANWGVGTSTQNSSTVANGQLALGQFNTSPTTISSGNMSPLQMDNAGNMLVNIKSPAAGSTTSSASLPVVIASDQAAVAVKAASGAFASGSIASGALASGSIASGAIAANAFASGAVPSGAYASGSLASGAVVDITNMSASTGAAAPSKAIYPGTLQSGATGGFIKGNITCDNHVFKHITSATDTLAVQGVASQTIYICSWRSRAAGVATWFLENTASTNANCSSTLTQITGVATEAANTGETWGSAFWSGLKNTSANGLCINSTGTGGVDVDIWYTQF